MIGLAPGVSTSCRPQCPSQTFASPVAAAPGDQTHSRGRRTKQPRHRARPEPACRLAGHLIALKLLARDDTTRPQDLANLPPTVIGRQSASEDLPGWVFSR
jgi:hypothetical protein